MSNVTCPRCGETYDHGKGGHFCLLPADGGDPYARISALEARVEELTREREGWQRSYEGVAFALGYAERPEGQDGVRVASHQTIMNAIHNLQRDARNLRDEVDAVGSVAKEAADWVRRLAELAPLLHVADRQEGEAEARAWLAAWDSAGAAIVEKRAAEIAAARAERDEAVGLLGRWLANGQCETVPLEERWKRKQEIVCGKCTTCQVLALLARLAAAPEKKTTPPGPYSNT